MTASSRTERRYTLGRVGLARHPRFSTGPARTLLGVSEYERLVELAAKGIAERDNHPMPTVTTPEAFYEIMARAALDAMGLQTLLEELARAEQELKHADERSSDLGVNAHTATTLYEELSEELSDSPQYVLNVVLVTRICYENGLPHTPKRHEQGTRKAENARLRSK
jgi:hypothetical protein